LFSELLVGLFDVILTMHAEVYIVKLKTKLCLLWEGRGLNSKASTVSVCVNG